MPKKSVRNRAIFAASQEGKSLNEIACLYGLKPSRVIVILREEGLKRRYSLEEAYRSLRLQSPLPDKV